jgi:predicted nucleic acid-binding protein
MVLTNPKTICWDTNCFCAWFNKEANRYDICAAIIEAAQNNEVKLYTSFLALAEIAKIPNEYPSEAEDTIAEFFKSRQYITLVSVDWSVTRIARDLRRRFEGLDGRDAVHLATAIRVKADVLHTYDKNDLLKLNGKIPGYSLSIIEPIYDFQTKLGETI